MKTTKKLDALTSLRFFAAALIVVYHASPAFGVGEVPASFDQGVSFFFVLSGFILAYVYPRLDGGVQMLRFWQARIARIWPGHVFAFLLVLALLPQAAWTISGVPELAPAAANLVMVHAWIPYLDYYYSFNSPSWSISTEFFFYLCFPLLLWRWHHTWLLKLAATLLIAIAIVAYCEIHDLPWAETEFKGVSSSALIYIHPLGRLFEFTLGMVAELAWESWLLFEIGAVEATLLEGSVVVLALASIAYGDDVAFFMQTWLDEPRHALAEWIIHSGSSLFFAALVAVIAMQRGWLSRLLQWPLLVLLGEASFAIYLTHQIILRRLVLSVQQLPAWPNWLWYGIYWALVLAVSLLVWRYVECPARRFLGPGSARL
ncbi:MAG: acyltransferase [Pseudomonadota bacterium]